MADPVVPPLAIQDPSVQQIILAFAESLLPLMGENGIKIANLVPATSAMLMLFQNFGKTNYLLEDLQSVINKNKDALEVLQGHINEMPDEPA